MSWLKWMLVALGTVVVLVVAILAALGLLSSSSGHEVKHIAVGQRTITVSHYKDMTQELSADGVKIVADGHVILVTPDSITIDGNAQSFDPAQDVEIDIDETGKISASAPTPPPGDSEDTGGTDDKTQQAQ